VLVLGVEGRLACQHIVEQGAIAEPVSSFGVAPAQDDLRGNIFGSAAHAVGHLIFTKAHFG